MTTGLSVGSITFGLYLLFIIAQIIILKHEFRKRDWLQIIFSSVFGVFTDLFLYVTLFINLDNVIFKIILCLISCVVIAFGVFIVVTTDVIMNAPDGLCRLPRCSVSRRDASEMGGRAFPHEGVRGSGCQVAAVDA